MRGQAREITVIEWWTEEEDGVYCNWRLPSGEILKRLTPLERSPVVFFSKNAEYNEEESK